MGYAAMLLLMFGLAADDYNDSGGPLGTRMSILILLREKMQIFDSTLRSVEPKMLWWECA